VNWQPLDPGPCQVFQCDHVGWLYRNGDMPTGMAMAMCAKHVRVAEYEALPDPKEDDELSCLGPSRSTPDSRKYCIRGHEWTSANTAIWSDGQPRCRKCASESRQRRKLGLPKQDPLLCRAGHEIAVHGWKVGKRGTRTCAECVRGQKRRYYLKRGFEMGSRPRKKAL
jgi:hypothetical protein